MLLPANIRKNTDAVGQPGIIKESSTSAVTQIYSIFQVSSHTYVAIAPRLLLFKSYLRRETERTKQQILHERFHGGGCQLLGSVLDKVKEDAAETNTVSVTSLDFNGKCTIFSSVSPHLQ